MRKLLLLLMISIPAISFSQLEPFGKLFDQVWGTSIVNFPEAEFISTEPDGESFFVLEEKGFVFETIGTLATYGRFRRGSLVGFTYAIDPVYSPKLVKRATELFGNPMEAFASPDGIDRFYTWEQGNTALMITLGATEAYVYFNPKKI